MGRMKDEPGDFQFRSFGELVQEPPEAVAWQWDGILPSGGTSILAARPKVGKSHTALALALRTAKGLDFLGRACRQGPVLYVACEGKRQRVVGLLRDMGAAESDPLHLHFGPPPIPRSARPEDRIPLLVAALEQQITLTSAVLVVIDTLFKFFLVVDVNDYSIVNNTLAPLEYVSRRTGAHIIALHHLNKIESGEIGQGFLGSTAIVGAVDTALELRRKDQQRELASLQRYGDDLAPTVLRLDDARVPTNGGSVEGYAVREAQQRIVQILEDEGELQASGLAEKVAGKTEIYGKALRELLERGTVKMRPEGKRRIYSLAIL